MRNITNEKSNLCKRILLPLFIALLLGLVSLVLVQPQTTAYADTVSGNINNIINVEVEEEQVYHATGCLPATLQQKLSVPELSLPDISTFSEEVVDYTDAFPKPGNQGSQGSCVAWAVGYAAKSYLVNIGEKWGVKNHQFSPAYIYIKLTAVKITVHVYMMP